MKTPWGRPGWTKTLWGARCRAPGLYNGRSGRKSTITPGTVTQSAAATLQLSKVPFLVMPRHLRTAIHILRSLSCSYGIPSRDLQITHLNLEISAAVNKISSLDIRSRFLKFETFFRSSSNAISQKCFLSIFEKSRSPGQCSSVGLSVALYTKRLGVRFLVRSQT